MKKEQYYFYKNRINSKIDELIELRFEMLDKTRGTKCLKCGIVQGTPFLGHHSYFCEHIDKGIRIKLNSKRKEIAKDLMMFVAVELPLPSANEQG